MQTMFIGIAGGSGSGKSTFTNHLKEIYGDSIGVIYHDNYYRARDDIPVEDRANINYDHPNALETALLVQHLKDLRKGICIDMPVYDFSLHTRSGKTERVEPKPVIIVEGILVLHNPELREMFDIKIYVDADADERILRRAMRDVNERGRNMEGIMRQYLATVKPMHYLYVEPTKSLADIVLNSGMNEIALELIKTKIDEIFRR